MDEEVITTEITVEEPIGNSARQELETLLNELLPEEKRTGDVDQMALDYIREMNEMNDRLVQALSNEPRLAQVFAEVVNGDKGAHSLVRHFGKEFLSAEEGTPEYEAAMAADKEYQEGKAQIMNAQLAFDEKANAWFDAFRAYCEKMNLNADVYLVRAEDEFILPLYEFAVSDEIFARIVKALDYDKDVEDAFDAGETKGRNTNINEMRARPTDGMPKGLNSQAAPVVERPKVRRNPLIADALNA